uniref:Secreted protein n=1 Tax=Pyricularia oryzae (strain P131) TaxID=1143193 RepID=L7J948_PYRO1
MIGFFFFFFFFLPPFVLSAWCACRFALVTTQSQERVRRGSLMASSMSALRWLWRGSMGSAAQSGNICSPFFWGLTKDWLVALFLYAVG